jgi:uncharacterized LabA/DUF88 family protein
MNNYAFIDGQNLYLGSKKSGINLNYRKFRVYLRDKYNIEKAFLFIGYLPENIDLYKKLKLYGYILKFKPLLPPKKDQKQKGNVDADLAFNVMRYYTSYNKAIIVTSDGDFDTLVKYIKKKSKLRGVISPSRSKCSSLLKLVCKDHIFYLEDVGKKICK